MALESQHETTRMIYKSTISPLHPLLGEIAQLPTSTLALNASSCRHLVLKKFAQLFSFCHHLVIDLQKSSCKHTGHALNLRKSRKTIEEQLNHLSSARCLIALQAAWRYPLHRKPFLQQMYLALRAVKARGERFKCGAMHKVLAG